MTKTSCIGVFCCLCAGAASTLSAQAVPLRGIPGVETEVGLQLFGAPITQTLQTDGLERMRLRTVLDPLGAYEVAFEARGGSLWQGWAPSFHVLATSLDRRRFYGYGSASAATLPSSAYEIRPFEGSLQAGLSYESPWLRLRLGPELRHVETRYDFDDHDDADDADDADELRPAIFDMRPYGIGSFTQVGLSGELSFRTDGPSSDARGGASLELGARWSPAALDVETPYAALSAEAAAFFRAGPPGSPLFAVRAGIEHATSGAPYFDAAYLGGHDRLRGVRSQRYAGQTAVWAGVENRLRLGSVTVRGLPFDFGTTAFVDVGRIAFEGEASSPLRAGYGGGLWARLHDGPSVSFSAARAGGSTRLYLRFGLFGWD